MSDAAALLAVLSVVGYVLLRHCCHQTSLRWDALEWQQNIFESTAVGLGLVGIFRSLVALLRYAGGPRVAMIFTPAQELATSLHFAHVGSVLGAGLTGLALSVAWNCRVPKKRAQAIAVGHHGGSLRSLLMNAHLENRAVMLSLTTRKVYVGWVLGPAPLRRPSWLLLLPTLSGHRRSENMSIEWTSDYTPAYTEIRSRKRSGDKAGTDLSHFQLALPLDSIASATYFDKDIYDRHFAAQRVAHQ